MLEFSEKLDQL